MTTEHAMGWRPGPMAGRSTIERLLTRKRTRATDRYYKSSLVLDQKESRCSAAYAFWHWLVVHDRDFVGIAPDGLAKLAGYREGQAPPTIEQIAAMLEQHGVLRASFWTHRALRIRDALQQGHGPVIVGSEWYAGMMAPDSAGYIQPAGRRLGRHCYLIVGYDQEREAFRLLNSWGPAWGQLGRAWMAAGHLAVLVANGEACAPQMTGDSAANRRWLELLAQDGKR